MYLLRAKYVELKLIIIPMSKIPDAIIPNSINSFCNRLEFMLKFTIIVGFRWINKYHNATNAVMANIPEINPW